MASLPRPVRALREDSPSARLVRDPTDCYFILLDRPVVLETHYLPSAAGAGGNTRGHYPDPCGYCDRKLTIVPQGYGPALAVKAGGIASALRVPLAGWSPVILHVPTSSVRRFEQDQFLRRVVKLRKHDPKTLAVDGAPSDPPFSLPPAFDLDYELAKYLFPAEWAEHLKQLKAVSAAAPDTPSTIPFAGRRKKGGAG
jgi:hypothetical protein